MKYPIAPLFQLLVMGLSAGIAVGATPQAHGETKVEAKTGATYIEADVKGLAQPTTFDAEFLTYVL
jgi:hypothetical protein